MVKPLLAMSGTHDTEISWTSTWRFLLPMKFRLAQQSQQFDFLFKCRQWVNPFFFFLFSLSTYIVFFSLLPYVRVVGPRSFFQQVHIHDGAYLFNRRITNKYHIYMERDSSIICLALVTIFNRAVNRFGGLIPVMVT